MAWIYKGGRGRKIFLNLNFFFFENLEIFILKWPKTEEILISLGGSGLVMIFFGGSPTKSGPPFSKPTARPWYYHASSSKIDQVMAEDFTWYYI